MVTQKNSVSLAVDGRKSSAVHFNDVYHLADVLQKGLLQNKVNLIHHSFTGTTKVFSYNTVYKNNN